MEFEKIVMERYACKKFDGQKIAAEEFEKLQELIRYAPSSFNLQTWKIKVVEDAQTKEKLLPATWNQPQINTCSHLLVFCAVKNVEKQIDMLEAALEKGDSPAESTAAYVKMMRDFASNMDEAQKLAWAQRQVYLAVENALLGAKALGFDSCPMEGFDAAQYSQI
ncbi:NAD(P)H-dependent oxidoreductase, partial [Candidatus Micrarchaeota archaeon CG10_big_fil_rev_8_21_14_0_10_45_29]